jgi:hypothetical protein
MRVELDPQLAVPPKVMPFFLVGKMVMRAIAQVIVEMMFAVESGDTIGRSDL